MTALQSSSQPLRVALVGFGVVGQGVYDLLLEDQTRFQVTGIICRDPERHIARGAPAALLGRDAEALAPHDVLVEAIGGLTPAREIALGAFARGADFVTANKSLVSRHYDELHAAAARARAKFHFSAAVGGGVPMLETVEEIARTDTIARIEAVLNGTTNFVLDRIGAGLSVEEAVKEAQDAGFAEADPSADIDGVDAAEKIALLARRAFSVAVSPETAPREVLSSISVDSIRAAHRDGHPYKQVASAYRTGGGVALEVQLRQVDAGSPLGRPQREENVLVVEREFGPPTVVFGKGAGRKPTAGSVFGDLAAIARCRLGSDLEVSAA